MKSLGTFLFLVGVGVLLILPHSSNPHSHHPFKSLHRRYSEDELANYENEPGDYEDEPEDYEDELQGHFEEEEEYEDELEDYEEGWKHGPGYYQVKHKPIFVDDKDDPYLRVSPPCPKYEDITPCSCMNYSTGRTFVDCDGILDINTVYRALHAPGYGQNPSGGFSMNYGKVQTIPLGLFSQVTFSTVSLDNNEISIVEAGSLTPLMYDTNHLSLSYNLIDIPLLEMCLGFTQLYQFDQRYNRITDLTLLTQIPGTIPSIITLGLSGNLITSVPAHAFKAIPNAEIIVLTENQISYIHPDAFLDLPKLNYLYLDGNRLNGLGSDSVGRIVVMRPITNLNLASNEVMDFEPGWVEGIGDPTGVVMDKNPMRHLREEAFGDVLRTISISDSPDAYSGFEFHNNFIDCDCDFLWVANDPNLFRHVKGGFCGNRSLPRHPIHDLDVEALKGECWSLTTTLDPSGPKGVVLTPLE